MPCCSNTVIEISKDVSKKFFLYSITNYQLTTIHSKLSFNINKILLTLKIFFCKIFVHFYFFSFNAMAEELDDVLNNLLGELDDLSLVTESYRHFIPLNYFLDTKTNLFLFFKSLLYYEYYSYIT